MSTLYYVDYYYWSASDYKLTNSSSSSISSLTRLFFLHYLQLLYY